MHLVSHLVALAGQAFFSGLWQGTVLVLGIALLFRFQPRISPATRFLVSICAFTLAALLPLFHARHLVSTASIAPSSVLHVAPVVAIAIAFVWLLLSAVRIGRLLYQALRIRRIWASATPVEVEAETSAILQALGRSAKLCTSHEIDSPCVIGFFFPRLLIPDTLMSQISAADLRQIVLHECTHLHRYDDWINLAQKVGLALFPLNPALLWIDQRLGLERELACDAAVVARTSAPFDYAHCLTRLAEHRLCSRRLALALSAWGRQSELLQRVKQLLRPASAISTLQARSTFALAGIALIAGSVAMAHAPRFIAFSAPLPTVESAGNTALALSTHAVAVPVVYRESTPAHAALLKYNAAPQRPKPAVAHVSAPHRTISEPPLAAPRFVRTSATSRSPRMTFGNAQEDQDIRPVYLFSVELSPSYAALPYGSGWLIVQL